MRDKIYLFNNKAVPKMSEPHFQSVLLNLIVQKGSASTELFQADDMETCCLFSCPGPFEKQMKNHDKTEFMIKLTIEDLLIIQVR